MNKEKVYSLLLYVILYINNNILKFMHIIKYIFKGMFIKSNG